MKFRLPPRFPPQISLWLLLAVALAVILAISFDKDGNFGKLSLRQSAIRETLTREPETEVPAEVPDTIDGAGEAQTDTTVHSVMVFGDSMTILVANRIAYYGAQNGYDVNSVTWYSSSTKVWGECDTLRHFIKAYNPDFIMVTLGANELFINNIADRDKYVKKIMEQIGDIPFVWIGPPNWKPDTGINDMLEKTLPKGTFFLTNGMTLERGSDKMHPTQKAADQWADSIMRWMPDSRHPILSAFPDTVTRKPPHNVKLLSPPKS